MSRMITLMSQGQSSAAEHLRILARKYLDYHAARGASPQLRQDAQELAVMARTAAERAEADPAGWGRPEPYTAMSKVVAGVLYAILTAEDADGVSDAGLRQAEGQMAVYRDRVRTALAA